MTSLLAAIALFSVPALVQPRTVDPPPVRAPAPTLKVGDPAPPLTVAKWLKGEPLQRLEPGRVSIVEFWATWCGPCVANIGHLNALQKRYADKGLTVIGVTKGDEQNSLEACQRLVDLRGDGMNYRVAFDADGKTYAAYMDAAGRQGIPASFVIDRAGKIAYIDHPAYLDLVVPAVLDGTWDATRGPAEVRAAAAALSELPTLIPGNLDAARKKWGELEKRWPALAASHQDLCYRLLVASGDAPGAAKAADAFVEHARSVRDFTSLHIFAWRMAVQPPAGTKPDLDRALAIAAQAVELSGEKDAECLRTLAKAHLLRGDRKKAEAAYDKALAVAEDHIRQAMTEDRAEFFKE